MFSVKFPGTLLKLRCIFLFTHITHIHMCMYTLFLCTYVIDGAASTFLICLFYDETIMSRCSANCKRLTILNNLNYSDSIANFLHTILTFNELQLISNYCWRMPQQISKMGYICTLPLIQNTPYCSYVSTRMYCIWNSKLMTYTYSLLLSWLWFRSDWKTIKYLANCGNTRPITEPYQFSADKTRSIFCLCILL